MYRLFYKTSFNRWCGINYISVSFTADITNNLCCRISELESLLESARAANVELEKNVAELETTNQVISQFSCIMNWTVCLLNVSVPLFT